MTVHVPEHVIRLENFSSEIIALEGAKIIVVGTERPFERARKAR